MTHDKRADCSVRALAFAAGIPYEVAHARLQVAGRVTNRGAYDHTMKAALRGIESRDVTPKRGIALSRFVREHPKGRYIVQVVHHYLAVVDGERSEHYTRVGARIQRYWQIRDPEVLAA